MNDADDLEAELQKAMSEAEEAIDKTTEAIENRTATPSRFGSEASKPERDPAEIVRELVAEAMADERASWEARLKAERDKLLRSMAEFENYKRRATRETDERIQAALGRLLEDFLPLGDNLSRAKTAAQGDAQILDGITIVEQAFFGALAKHEIAPVLALGCSFNPEIHDALAQQVNDQERGIIVEEFEKGYTWRGRLLRPAKVVVSMGKKEEE